MALRPESERLAQTNLRPSCAGQAAMAEVYVRTLRPKTKENGKMTEHAKRPTLCLSHSHPPLRVTST